MMGDKQRKLRKWFQRHKWHTADTPTGHGFWLSSPIENCAGNAEYARDPKTNLPREFAWERMLGVELDRFTCDTVTFSIYKRRHWWKRDPTAKTDGTEYTWIPSDDFDEWKRQPDASIQLPARDIVKLAELIQAAQEDWSKGRPSKNHLNFMERIAKQCDTRWIGVNSSYDEIKQTYSNERLRKERAEREKGHGEGAGNHSADGEGTEHRSES